MCDCTTEDKVFQKARHVFGVPFLFITIEKDTKGIGTMLEGAAGCTLGKSRKLPQQKLVPINF